jgi:hypothetical protein
MYGSYVGEDTSLASLGQEAGNGLYMPWPQSGRKQYEENKKNKKIKIKIPCFEFLCGLMIREG